MGFDQNRRWLPRPTGPLFGLMVVLGLFVLLLAWKQNLGYFARLENLQTLLHQNSVAAVVALGMLVVIVSGGIDLSVGSVVALVTVVAMQTFRWLEAAPGWENYASCAAVSAGLLAGTLCGLINGLVITRLRVVPFVATLGMLSVARGLAVGLAGRTRVSFRGARPAWVDMLGQSSSPYLVDPGVWSVVVLAILIAWLLRATVFGRYCFAIGASPGTARMCGITVERYQIAYYSLSGLCAGWAGILWFAHGTSGDPNAGVGLELDAIAAVVVGGAALSGGRGTVFGTLLGVLILGIVENGLSFLSVALEVKYVLIGAIVVINTALSGSQSGKPA